MSGVTVTIALLIAAAGVVGVIIYMIWKQSSDTARLRLENEAHRDRERIEKDAKEAWNTIDDDTQSNRAAARNLLSGLIKSRKDS